MNINTPPLALLVLLQTVVSAASLVVEIVAGRMLAPYVGMSLYTWTAVIAVVLAGFSAGHWWGGIMAGKPQDTALKQTGWVLIAAALSTGIAVVVLQTIAGPVMSTVTHPLWAIIVLCTGAFFLPSLFAGVPAPVLAQIGAQTADNSGRALGALFAAGAIGAIAGTLLAGFVFISYLGSTVTLGLVAAVYVALALLAFWLAGSLPRAAIAAAVLSLGLAGYALASPSPCDTESDYFCIRTIDISDSPDEPVRMMVLDHLVHGTSARNTPTLMYTDHAAMLDTLAMLRAPEPAFSSFFIGGGSFSLPRSFAAREGHGPITVAEMDPKVTEVAARDFWFDRSRATVLHQDARVVLNRSPQKYDLIIGDAFTDIAVPQHLITREFFQLVSERLTPQGSYLMNVVDFEDNLQTLGAMLRTLQTVFPVLEVWVEERQPVAGERMVFIITAGNAKTSQASFTTLSPNPARYGALSDAMLASIMSKDTLILTDDFAPIDRLMGLRPD
ncbi:fused MFS/spermidine synthase [Lentibacter sp. XHP0401]|jgi:spermidine synthase|uniref:fused MFS/spermidine synthase n=1 Tax=Lentibacter sp. XHP0401 TaxID=2984334 RepID=UPI0021E99053|nr:fused MFS/spermidine synthase [Lentibacter sp. XHP0401]MCV2892399.1 fused MFS/spermidine synthase [Lentibacter sp. XHP0401]